MYRKITQGWLKHIDFIVLDLLCLHIAFVFAYMVRLYLCDIATFWADRPLPYHWVFFR